MSVFRVRRKKGIILSVCLGFAISTVSCSAPPAGMIWIPPGPFTMGSDEKDDRGRSVDLGLTKRWFEDEAPARVVELPGFYIDRYEATNRDFANFVRKSQVRPPVSWKNGQYPSGMEQFPVTDVTWHQAEAFCAWAGKRLPTEAEWEKAARGPKGLRYPWGDVFDAGKGNLLSKGLRPVGSFPQGESPYRVDDMIGNVWEWTADWYRPYPGNTVPSEKYGQSYKVIRGKSWTRGFGHQSAEEMEEIAAHEARASYRLYFDPDYSFADLGFRCVKNK